jgi:hypothetical protein
MVAFSLSAAAHAQDPFEIHVYEYETLKPGQFTLEQHLNYWGIGSKQSDRTVAPTNDQFHMTYEITGGITRQISLGLMQLSGVRPGGSGLEYAGWRLLPHFYAPSSWHLPVALGLVAELSFVRPSTQPIGDTSKSGQLWNDELVLFSSISIRFLHEHCMVRGRETVGSLNPPLEPPTAIPIPAGWSLTLSGTANSAHCPPLRPLPLRSTNCSPVWTSSSPTA